MNDIKDQQVCDAICKSHSARSERDIYRVCPSKLSKRELENLYFALLENNLELKKTLHSQQEKLKVLSTKVQRMTVVQRNAAGKDKDCCISKVVVSEQKEMILELKKANDGMAERIRLLNMRLCSAKQFLKRSPTQAAKCTKCARCTAAPVSFKNSSMSALNSKPSELSVKTTAVSACQYLAKDAPQCPRLLKEVETETDLPEKEDGIERECNENKCRTLMDELKQKIVHLQEELSKTHSKYSKHITKLETEVSGLHEENLRVRSSNVASEHALQQRERRADDLKGKLREAEGKISDLTMQLTIERRKVTEFRTALKLANKSNQMAKTIENLNFLQQEKPQAETDVHGICPVCSFCPVKRDTEVASASEVNRKGKNVQASSPKRKEDGKFSKSDDSGYIDLNKSSETEEDKRFEKLNQDVLVKRIAELQTQLDGLRIKAVCKCTNQLSRQKSNNLEYYNVDTMNELDLGNLQKTTVIEERPEYVLEIEGLDANQIETTVENDIDTSTSIKDTENDQRILKGHDNTSGAPREGQRIAEPSVTGVEHRSNTKFKTNAKLHTHQSKTETVNSNDGESDKDAINSKNINSKENELKEKKKPYKKSKESFKKGSFEEKSMKNGEKKKDHIYKDALYNATLEEKKSVNKPTIDKKETIQKKVQSETKLQGHKKKIADDQKETLIDTGDESRGTQMQKEQLDTIDPHAHVSQAHAPRGRRDSATYTAAVAPAARRDSATYTHSETHTHTDPRENNMRARATSPENTDHEISSLSDLPPERDRASPRDALSPGEQGPPTTDSETGRTPDYGYLSEGELPGPTRDVRSHKLSLGEKPTYLDPAPVPGRSSAQMEAALQAISEELARCRMLLTSARNHEVLRWSSVPS